MPAGRAVIAQKGPSAQEETRPRRARHPLLGGQVRQVIPVELLGLAEARNLVVIEKVARTPQSYPRRPGMPAKRPLRNPVTSRRRRPGRQCFTFYKKGSS